ncbi:ATP-binding protein [Dethiosulfatarculus sandiegensis]|uniref:Histidine kinase/HSP90-like ATPase domain-containing protein n=1 Tax=Dethiosulfatarculus sandiegensis TaxID=1429043 RepID=A0A0D2HK20_9BACT|nr:ATP-binding protein [Dethiosulfatarculus sandiegensis]KIX10983.1 hypothetical protein X474_26795 [Dethiosulfatarculus sandiegensis]
MHLAIDSRLIEVRVIAEQIKKFCLKHDLDPEDGAMVELAVVEALNNVIKHSYGNQPGHRVEVDLEALSDRLVFTILNWGIPFSQKNRAELKSDPTESATLSEGGMGLFIIDQVMDKVEYLVMEGANVHILTKFRV